MTAIDDKWNSLGGASSPVGDIVPGYVELPTPDRRGTYRHYSRGSIYHKHYTFFVISFDVCPHAIYGAIRDYWASMGWETSPLGWPIADEQPARTTDLALYRFSDFENGVLYWSARRRDPLSGEERPPAVTNLSPLAPSLIRSFSRGRLDPTAAGLTAMAREIITTRLAGRAEVRDLQVTAAPEYTCQGGVARNRFHLVRVVLQSTSGCILHPVVDLTLVLEVTFNRATRVVEGILRSWSLNNISNLIFDIGRGEIESGIRGALDPMVGTTLMSETLPDSVNVLAVKTMLNGDVNVYIEPVCLITTASARATGLPEDHPDLEAVRQFRDTYLNQLPGGHFLTSLYYWFAPQVVAEIDSAPNAEQVYQTLYKSYIAPAVERIRAGNPEDVFNAISPQIPEWIAILAASDKFYDVADDLRKRLVPLAIELLGKGQVEAFNKQALEIAASALQGRG